MWTSAKYIHARLYIVHVRPHDMYTFNTQQASYQFWRGACDACAADHVINSSRPSASIFLPPHLIITHNAHGAEEGEGLGTRLEKVTLIVSRRHATVAFEQRYRLDGIYFQRYGKFFLTHTV